MDKMLKVALMLTAIDKMSGVVSQATGKALGDLEKVEAGTRKMRDGLLMMSAGKTGFTFLEGATDAFGKLEASGNRLKTSIMTDGGILDTKVYDRMISKSQELSEKYANTSEEYLNMMRVLKNNGIKEEDILGSIGEANEKLAVALDVAPSQAAMFVSHMKRDMGIANKDMMGMMDLIARMHNVGVGATGAETVNEMNQFFSKEGLSASIMGSLGLKESKDVAAIAALFMRRGLSGQTVGTNFRRMLDTMRNPKAMKEVNDQAKHYGIALDLFDKKTHQFKGFSNMVQQFDKLRGLPVQAIDKITHAFGGRQGLSNDFIGLLSKEGVADFNEVMKDMYKQADITQKVNVLTLGQEYRIKRLSAAWTNLKANFGASLAPIFTTIIDKFTKAAQAVGRFTVHHPGVARFIGTLIGLASTVIIAAGAFRLLKGSMLIIDGLLGITKAIKWLRVANVLWASSNGIAAASNLTLTGAIWKTTAALLANPITWIILAVAALALGTYALIKNWSKVAPFFRGMWAGIKMAFSFGLTWIKRLLFDWTPVGLIYNNWGKIAPWFDNLFAQVRVKFMQFVIWVMGLPKQFLIAGINIVKSIGDGIAKGWHFVVDKVKALATKVRSYFPFSPAKEGPLRDIHRVRLIETIAESIKPASILAKMKHVASAIFDFAPSQSAQAQAGLSSSGLGSGLVIAPVFHYHAAPGESAGGNSAQMTEWFRRNSRVMVDLLQEEMRKRQRTVY